MLVRNWMTKEVITVDINDSMNDAIRQLKEHNIRMLPVTHEARLVGVVTDRDLKRASASDATTLDIHALIYLVSQIRIRQVMTKNPITVPPDYTMEEAAEILLKSKISGMPVVDEKGKIQGIITQSDIFKVLISLSGVGKKGIQFALRIRDKAGSIREVADVIRNYEGRIVSIFTSYERVAEGQRNVYIRAKQVNRDKLEALLKDLNKKAILLYMVDHCKNERKIYV